MGKDKKEDPAVDPRNAYYTDNITYKLQTHIEYLFKLANEARIASGYFYASGYYLIEDLLTGISSEKGIKLLIGKETDIVTKTVLKAGTKAYREQQDFKKQILEEFKKDAHSIDDPILEKRLEQLYSHLKSGLLQPKVWVANKFHPKLYLFEGDQPTWTGEGIVGSSNFTKSGLTENLELNVIIKDNRQLEELEKWFDNLYEQAEPIKDQLEAIIEITPSFQRKKDPAYITPWELFLCIAREFLNRQINYAQDFLAEFQKTGYYSAMTKIEKYGGCIIADSVGLGKSFIGGEILKYFRNEDKKVLAFVPAHIVDQWKTLLEIDGPPNNPDEVYFGLKVDGVDLTVESQGLLSRMKPEDCVKRYGQYDVILVDEAHRFRNDPKEITRCENLKALKDNKNRGEQDAVKFIFITATPLNNSIRDLYNLINLLVNRNRLESYEGMNLKAFESFEKLRRKESKGKPLSIAEIRELQAAVKDIEIILDQIMVLRNREYLQNKAGGIVIGGHTMRFTTPILIPTHYKQKHPKYQLLYSEIPEFFEKLKAPHIVISNPNAGMVLQGLYKVLLLKRLESGIYSFTVSLEHYLNALKELEKLLDDPNIEYEDIIKTKLTQGTFKGLKSVKADTDLMSFISDVQETEEEWATEEASILAQIQDEATIREWIANDRKLVGKIMKKYIGGKDGIKKDDRLYEFHDTKIDQLLEIFNLYPQEKFIVYTQYIDTINYLQYHIDKYNQQNPMKPQLKWGYVTGQGTRHHQLRENVSKRDMVWMFSPISNEKRNADGTVIPLQEENEINIMLANDALSEGANLQDCNFLINYDLPWNPTRIIQRIGRIDRIVREGEPAQNTVWNFILEEALQLHISLIERLKEKIHQIATIIGKEYRILHEDEEVGAKRYGELEKDDISLLKENLEKIQNAESTTTLSRIGKNRFLSEKLGEDEKANWAISIESVLREFNVQQEDLDKARNKFPKEKLRFAVYKGKNPEMLLYAQIYDFKRKRKRANLCYVIDVQTKKIAEKDPGNMGFKPELPGYRLEEVSADFNKDKLLKQLTKAAEHELERHKADVQGMRTKRYGTEIGPSQRAIARYLDRITGMQRLDGETVPEDIEKRLKEDAAWYKRTPLLTQDVSRLKRKLSPEWQKKPIREIFEMIHNFRLEVERGSVEYRTTRIRPEDLTIHYIAGGICLAEDN